MRLLLTSATLICTLSMLGSAAASSAESTSASRQAVALWLSRQIHQPVAASQLLVAPTITELDGCSVMPARSSLVGTTALALHCPGEALPQLALLSFPVALPDQPSTPPASAAHHALLRVPPIVRAGAALNADWRTAYIHAQLPVVALDSGAAGEEIRVRLTHSNRILRARILGAHTVSIVTESTNSEHPL
jgi:hypothetical protein